GIVRPGPPGVRVIMGDVPAAPVAVAVAGLFITLWLQARGHAGTLLIGILLTTLLARRVNMPTGGGAFTLPGQAVIPKSVLALPDFSSLGSGINVEVFARVGA